MKLNSLQNNLRAICTVEIPNCKIEAGSWVKLLELPSPYSFDKALLLCEISEYYWLSWIPDHGEAVLDIRLICNS